MSENNVMMQVFSNSEFGKIRAVKIDDAPWFIGRDVAAALGYGDGNSKSTALANALTDHVDEEDRRHVSYEELKSHRNGEVKDISRNGCILVNESGVYSLIFGSKLKSAKRFKRWVTSEVLPSIHKTGTYSEVQIETVRMKEKSLAEANKKLILVLRGGEKDKPYTEVESALNKVGVDLKEVSKDADVKLIPFNMAGIEANRLLMGKNLKPEEAFSPWYSTLRYFNEREWYRWSDIARITDIEVDALIGILKLLGVIYVARDPADKQDVKYNELAPEFQGKGYAIRYNDNCPFVCTLLWSREGAKFLEKTIYDRDFMPRDWMTEHKPNRRYL